MQNNVDNLVDNLEDPLFQSVEAHILANQVQIEAWFRKCWHEKSAPFYCSVDLRNAGFKIAPVDTNLFPGGFNNLPASVFPLCVQAIQHALSQRSPTAEKILLIPENHTSNVHYFENIYRLLTMLRDAGFETELGSLLPTLRKSHTIKLSPEKELVLHPILCEDNRLKLSNFDPDLLILNNDFSDGVPDCIRMTDQLVLPSAELGWASRLKSKHFTYYSQVVKAFSAKIDIDPWLIDPYFEQCESVDFVTRQGETCIAKRVEALLLKIQKKYDAYQIKQTPYVAIKADAGTYGMGVMMLRSPDELLHLNRKQRQKMAVGKNKKQIDRVILQEGVYTLETAGENKAVAEPVIYLIGEQVVGGFYRIHAGKAVHDNLNAPGSAFHPLCIETACTSPHEAQGAAAARYYVYGVIARLAALAAAYEMAAL